VSRQSRVQLVQVQIFTEQRRWNEARRVSTGTVAPREMEDVHKFCTVFFRVGPPRVGLGSIARS
jgi:hypothetical protein